MKCLVIASVLFAVAACGGHGDGDIDEVVGAACTSDRDVTRGATSTTKTSRAASAASRVRPTTTARSTPTACRLPAACASTRVRRSSARLGPAWTCRDKSRADRRQRQRLHRRLTVATPRSSIPIDLRRHPREHRPKSRRFEPRRARLIEHVAAAYVAGRDLVDLDDAHVGAAIALSTCGAC